MTIVVLIGVSGSGKTTIGRRLAAMLDVPFLEGDDCHSAANHAKMASGISLDDADRAPWLAAIADWMAAHRDGVVACSALKRAYRDRLRAGAPDARLVLLMPSPSVLAERVETRRGHFMPASLLGSQRATLEMPREDEDVLVVAGERPVDATLAEVRAWLARIGDFCCPASPDRD